MDSADVFGPIASFMGVLMSLAPMFQVRRVLERQTSDDVSQLMPTVIAVGAAAWLAYGISISDVYLIIPNFVGVISNVGTLLVVRRYRTVPQPVLD
jgi:uncharacterized protein with PQ loop repeat